ncbi:polysaccharide deacetylase family protein [Paenibacillus marinisediminis]
MLKKMVMFTLCFMLICTPAYSAPAKKDRLYYEKRGDIIWEVKTKQKLIALTFDDGPDPRQTTEILKLLNQYGAKSTFFVIGKRVARYPELVRTILADGHEIANHTYNHVYFDRHTSEQRIRQELEQTQQAIRSAANYEPTLFRPPGGMYNDLIVNTAKSIPLKSIMWSWHQDTRDWSLPGVNRITEKVLNNARNGDIVLFHDFVSGRSQTKAALEIILPELKKQGFQFVTVTELLKHSGSQLVDSQSDSK